MELDLSGLTEDEKERLLVVINRAVELACTVGRTSSRAPRSTWRSSMSAPDVRLTAWVHGWVQGVGFRWWTRCRALELGLTGYAANHADGRVLVVAQGPRAACQKLLQLLQGDTTPGRVAKVVADWSQSTEQITGFSER